jgi:spectinomycin phosphotransferase
VIETIRHEQYPDTWFRSVREYLRSTPAEAPSDDVTRDLVELLSTKRVQIETLADRAEVLADSLKRRALPFVPCHGDLHAGNVLVTDTKTLFIIDWDDPLLALKERDLMFIGGGVGGAWNRPEESVAFYQGYGTAAVDGEAIAYYRCVRIVEDIVVFCDSLFSDGGGDAAERRGRLTKLASAFGPNDVVEIAESALAAL